MGMSFTDMLARERYILLDGGMWRLLQAKGLGDDPPELWNLTHPDRVTDVHRAYVEAGSRVVYTNSLGGNRLRLAQMGLADRLAEVNWAAVKAALAAAGGAVFVAGDISTTGAMLEPYGDLSRREAVEIYAEQARVLAEAGVGLFVVETMLDLAEACAAVEGIQSVSALPIVCTLSFGPGGRTMMGDTPEKAVRELTALGVAAVGANCSGGAREMLPVIQAMAGVAGIPLVAKPNAGIPELIGTDTVFPDSPAEMAEGAGRLAEAGAVLVGGCCGSTPDHLRAIRARLEGTRG